MSLTVYVLNREQAEQLEPIENAVMISISGPDDPANLKEGWFDILRLEFHDLTEPIEGYNHFSPAQADTLLSYIEDHIPLEFIVHCDAGISRSVAVGRFLQAVYDYEPKLRAAHSDICFNVLVYNQLRRAWMRRHGKYW